MMTPAFCPNSACPCHHLDQIDQAATSSRSNPATHLRGVLDSVAPTEPFGVAGAFRGKQWFSRKGFYESGIAGRVQRFRCKVCGTGFSEQTYSLDYFAKRRVSYSRIEQMICSTASLRDIARTLRISLGTVSNRISRLARQAMAAHVRTTCRLVPTEPLVTDGFESYVWSQYFPNNINLLIGADSQYLFGATYCTIRRKGNMTEAQRRHRAALEALYRAPPGTIRHSFEELLDQAIPLVLRQLKQSKQPIELRSDEKREYRTALGQHPFYRGLHGMGLLLHRTVSSRAVRTISNPLFAVNYFDRELRKDMANHVRETVCFARNVNAAMERFWIYTVHHNLVKRYRERQPVRDTSTHATVAGLSEATVARTRRHYFTRRVFFHRIEAPPGSLVMLWRRQLETPLHPNGADSLPRYAVA